MRFLLVSFLLATASAFAGDDALRSLLGVQSQTFEMPRMAKDSRCEVDIISYVDGVPEKHYGVIRVGVSSESPKAEVLWLRSPEHNKILFSYGGGKSTLTINAFPEDACGSVSTGRPPYPMKDGWAIVAYWVLNKTENGHIVYPDFEKNLKGNKRVLAIAVREVNDRVTVAPK